MHPCKGWAKAHHENTHPEEREVWFTEKGRKEDIPIECSQVIKN